VPLSRELLARSQLSVISAEPDPELDRIAGIIRPSVRIGGRAELEELLAQLLAARDGGATTAPKTLDLIGHSTASAALLRLGDWIIDAASPPVAAWLRALAARDVLPRLGIHAVRLLACRTTDTDRGRATVGTLAELLGVEVHGTNHLLHAAHYDEHGFRDAWRFLLVSAGELRRRASAPTAVPDVPRGPRTLEVDALPTSPLGAHGVRPDLVPRHVATASAARQILQLVRQGAGAPMPGLPEIPERELALPLAEPGAYHVAHVLRDGAFLRLYPDGVAAPGVVYPVEDPRLLRQIVEGLPPHGVSR
jgi:hypothetical protein